MWFNEIRLAFKESLVLIVKCSYIWGQVTISPISENSFLLGSICWKEREIIGEVRARTILVGGSQSFSTSLDTY